MNFEKILSIFLLVFSFANGGCLKSRNKRSKKSSHSASTNPKSGMKDDTQGDYWCYHCATSRRHESQEMLTAMDQLLQLRGSSYPYNAVFEQCHTAGNYSLFPKQYCKYPFCHKITFDDGEGLPLTIRGCSEKFIASNEREFCRRIHRELDITECSCKKNGLCDESSGNRVQTSGFRTFASIFVISGATILFSTYLL